MQTALITGCNGFCGRHLAAYLRRRGEFHIVGVDQQPAAAVAVDEYVAADLSQPGAALGIAERHQPGLIFHLAGTSTGSDSEIYRANLLTTVLLLEAVRGAGAHSRVLLVGSAAEYGRTECDQSPLTEESACRPQGAYGISKHAATLAGLDFARRYAMKVVIARPFNIVGAGVPASLVIGGVLQRLRAVLAGSSDLVVSVGNLEPQRDFVAVDDVVDAYFRMLSANAWGQVFNICSGTPVPVRRVVETLLSFSPRKVRLQVDPALCRCDDVRISYGSYEKAQRAFGFQPALPLESALRAAWDHALGGNA